MAEQAATPSAAPAVPVDPGVPSGEGIQDAISGGTTEVPGNPQAARQEAIQALLSGVVAAPSPKVVQNAQAAARARRGGTWRKKPSIGD